MSEYQHIKLTKEETLWIDEQVKKHGELVAAENTTDTQIKDAFDVFYDGVVELYKKYPTKMLRKFYATGFNYDGYLPNKNRNFLALYEELINMVKDKIVDKPIKYFVVQDEKLVPILEHENGTIEYI